MAYECFCHAAEAGIAEGCYKLGDMLAEAEAVLLIMRRRSTCSCGRTCVTDIAAGTFYTRYMIEEDDTMDEVVKADSSAGKT